MQPGVSYECVLLQAGGDLKPNGMILGSNTKVVISMNDLYTPQLGVSYEYMLL